MNNTRTVLTAENITRTYPGGHGQDRVRAVDGVDLTVERGDIVALLGPNGAGKTTLIDIALGLTTAESGRIQLFGERPRDAVSHGRASALLQTGGLLPDLTVRETLRMIAALHRNPRGIDEVLSAAGATSFADRRVSKCSGGQQQRLKFALALLPRPELLFLDEPTAGMDVTARHDFWASMSSLADGGTTILFATHYLEEAERFARRTVMMSNGRILADGPTADVRSLAGVSRITVTWRPNATELAQLDHVLTAEQRGPRLELRTDDADALSRQLLTTTDAHHLEVETASLDEAFRYLTDTTERAA